MIVDLVILILVAVMAVFGFYKGFIKSVISLLGFILSLALSILLARVVANALLSADFIGELVAGDKSLYSWLFSKLPKSLENIKTSDLKTAASVEALFKDEAAWFIKLFYPLMSSGLNNSVYWDTLDNARQIMGLELAYGIFTLIVGVLLFIAIRIVAAIVSLIFKKYTKGKKTVTGRAFGAVIGACKAVVYCMIILCLLTFVSNFSFMEPVNEKIAESRLGVGLTDAAVRISSATLKGKDETRYKRLVELSGLGGTKGEISSLEFANRLVIELARE